MKSLISLFLLVSAICIMKSNAKTAFEFEDNGDRMETALDLFKPEAVSLILISLTTSVNYVLLKKKMSKAAGVIESCSAVEFVCDKAYGDDRSCSYQCVSNKPRKTRE